MCLQKRLDKHRKKSELKKAAEQKAILVKAVVEKQAAITPAAIVVAKEEIASKPPAPPVVPVVAAPKATVEPAQHHVAMVANSNVHTTRPYFYNEHQVPMHMRHTSPHATIRTMLNPRMPVSTMLPALSARVQEFVPRRNHGNGNYAAGNYGNHINKHAYATASNTGYNHQIQQPRHCSSNVAQGGGAGGAVNYAALVNHRNVAGNHGNVCNHVNINGSGDRKNSSKVAKNNEYRVEQRRSSGSHRRARFMQQSSSNAIRQVQMSRTHGYQYGDNDKK